MLCGPPNGLTNNRPSSGPVKISSQGCPYIFQSKCFGTTGPPGRDFSGPFRHQNAFTSILIGLKSPMLTPGQKVFLSPKLVIFPPEKKNSPTPRSKSSTKRTASKSPFQRYTTTPPTFHKNLHVLPPTTPHSTKKIACGAVQNLNPHVC